VTGVDGLDQHEEPDDHRDDGLDLARSIARSLGGRRRTTKKRRGVTPPQFSGAHPDDRDPQLLGAMVDKLVGDHGWELELRVRGVFARWPELVGDEIAAHTTPETFADGKLVVRTDSTAWATQLTYLVPTVLKRLNEDLGAGTVTLLEVLGPQGPSWKKGRLSSRDGRGPRDTYG
jgi:predicted nucleic acid-binding Zn ribbon protein